MTALGRSPTLGIPLLVAKCCCAAMSASGQEATLSQLARPAEELIISTNVCEYEQAIPAQP